jgi:antitoxin PrlF
MTVATITSKGQITIPAAVRKSLGVGFGDRLAFVRTPSGQFEISPARESVRTLKGFGAKSGRKLSIDEMNRIIATRRTAK